jgi:hypothetical protein
VKKASAQSVRVDHTLWPSPASRRSGIASTRLGANATGSHGLPENLLPCACLLTLAGQDREPHTLVITFDHMTADSRQPRKAGSELHCHMHSRSGFRYLLAALWNLGSSLSSLCTPHPLRAAVSWHAVHLPGPAGESLAASQSDDTGSPTHSRGNLLGLKYNVATFGLQVAASSTPMRLTCPVRG